MLGVGEKADRVRSVGARTRKTVQIKITAKY